jgi:hypothetical protein
LQPHHLDLTVKEGAGSVMLWGCMTWDGLDMPAQLRKVL